MVRSLGRLSLRQGGQILRDASAFHASVPSLHLVCLVGVSRVDGDGMRPGEITGSEAFRIDGATALDWARNADDAELMAAAHRVRCAKNPAGEVTYLVDRNINYSNVCITDCLFCGFYARPGQEGGYVLTREVLARKMAELVEVGGSRVLLQGGHNPDLPLSWYEDLFRWMRLTFPSIQIDGLSPSEIDHIASIEDLPVREVLARLQEAGLAYLPGGGAELLVDRIRRKISVKKIPAARWIDIMDVAQSLGLGTSASMVIGVDESWEDRIEHLEVLRAQQDRARARGDRGFAAFIMWPMLLDNSLGKVLKRDRPIPTGDYLRTLSLARLILDNFDHVQASWPTMGPEVAQVALHAGADSIGSTMMEENVVSQSGAVHEMMTEEMLRDHITRAGFTPVKRDSNFAAETPA